jgi:site-specific DNA recombinase
MGEVLHRGQSYPGLHQPIVPRKLWNQVTARLKENNQAHRMGKSRATPSLLSGKLFDSNGVRFTPTHAVKNAKRYRYYTSQAVVQQVGVRPAITRFPAQELEQLVKAQVHLLLQKPEKCTTGMRNTESKGAAAEKAKDLAKKWPLLAVSTQHEFIRTILKRVTIGQTTLWIEIDKSKLVAALLELNSEGVSTSFTGKSTILKLTSAFQALRQRGELRVIAPLNDGACFEGSRVPSLVKAVARAHNWYEQIVTGEISTVGQLAQKTALTRRYVRRILQCARLSPQITEALLTGKHPPNLTLKEIQHSVPLNWREQEKRLLRSA